MRKRILSITLAFCMAVVLVGCGNGGENVTPAKADENGNYVVNGSFEEVELTGWTVTNVNNSTEEINVYTRETDCVDGVQSLHFYSGTGDVNFTVSQVLSGLEDGAYKLTGHVQGDAAGDENAVVKFYVMVDGEEFASETTLDGYLVWNTVEIEVNVTGGTVEIGFGVNTAPGGWGTIDDITLVKE